MLITLIYQNKEVASYLSLYICMHGDACLQLWLCACIALYSLFYTLYIYR